jgi:hypothetical protein
MSRVSEQISTWSLDPQAVYSKMWCWNVQAWRGIRFSPSSSA